jgi:hypothetical protein
LENSLVAWTESRIERHVLGQDANFPVLLIDAADQLIRLIGSSLGVNCYVNVRRSDPPKRDGVGAAELPARIRQPISHRSRYSCQRASAR